MSIFRRAANLNWVAVVLFPSTVILMEVMWVYPWLIRIGSWPVFHQDKPPLSLASVAFLLCGAFFATRFFIKQKTTLKWTRLSLLACGLVTTLIILRIQYPDGKAVLDGQWFIYIIQRFIDSFSHPNLTIVALIVGLYLWWRGIGLGHSPLFFDNIYRSFSVGLIAQVALILAWGSDRQNSFMSTTGLYVAGFFFFGLSAMALAKLKGTQERGQKEGMSSVFNGRWLSIIIVVIMAIVLVGIGAASIFSPNFLSVLGTLFNLISGLLFKIVYYILTVFLTIVGFSIALTLYIFQAIINMLQGKTPPEAFSSANMTEIQGLKQAVSQEVSPETMLVIKWVLFTLVLSAMVILIARSVMRRRPSQTKDDVEEINESLWSWDGFLTDLQTFFRLLWQRFRGKIKTVILDSTPGHKRHREKDVVGRLNVRELYRHLLLQAAQFGITRRPQETPYEYTERLGQSVPEGIAPLNELTDLYVQVRYGGVTSEDKQVDRANSLWEAIMRLLTRDKAEQAE